MEKTSATIAHVDRRSTDVKSPEKYFSFRFFLAHRPATSSQQQQQHVSAILICCLRPAPRFVCVIVYICVSDRENGEGRGNVNWNNPQGGKTFIFRRDVIGRRLRNQKSAVYRCCVDKHTGLICK